MLSFIHTDASDINWKGSYSLQRVLSTLRYRKIPQGTKNRSMSGVHQCSAPFSACHRGRPRRRLPLSRSLRRRGTHQPLIQASKDSPPPSRRSHSRDQAHPTYRMPLGLSRPGEGTAAGPSEHEMYCTKHWSKTKNCNDREKEPNPGLLHENMCSPP